MPTEADCLVTGASGFLGRTVVNALLKEGARVRCLLRESSENPIASSLIEQSGQCEIRRGNLLSPAQIARAMDGVRVVYHLAAEMRGLAATIFAGTVVGSKNLLEAILRARPQRVVLISSLNVYGLAGADPRNIVSEEFPLDDHPEKRDVYTHAKIWQERLFLERLTESGIDLTIVRPGHIYGPNRRQLPARLGLSFCGVLLRAGSSRLLPITYVENCADAVIFCGTKREAANEAYNVVDDGVPTSIEYLRWYRRVSRTPRTIRMPRAGFSALAYLNRLGNQWSAGQIPIVLTRYKSACAWRGHRFSNQKLKGLGWQQPVSTQEALALTFPFPTSSRVPPNQLVQVPLRSAT